MRPRRETCGSLASYQRLPHIYHHLVVTFISTCHVLSNVHTPFLTLLHLGRERERGKLSISYGVIYIYIYIYISVSNVAAFQLLR